MYRLIEAKVLLSHIKQPDIFFGLRYNMNLYRGCEHRCIYCDSRSECYQIENFDGEVLVKVAAVGICGSDHHYYSEGAIGGAIVDEGMVMGHEFSGWIAEIGSGVEHLRVGQLVAVEPAISCGTCEFCRKGHPNICPNVLFCGSPNHVGAMADYIRMPAENCLPLPQDMTPAEGAMTSCTSARFWAVTKSSGNSLKSMQARLSA